MVFPSFSTSLTLSLGNFSTWPILRILLVKLLILFSSSTVVLYLLAIEYKESPFFTIYVDSGNNALGIFSNCPVDRILDVKLLILFNSSTVVLLAAAIEYKVSPFLTM